MKKSIILIASLVLSVFNSFAQDQDPKAKTILDDLSKVTKAYKTITSDYILPFLIKKKNKLKNKQVKFK